MRLSEFRQLIREEVKKLRASKGKQQSLQESFSWERQPGKPLPTLSDVREAYQKKKKLKEESEDSWGNEEDYGTKDLDSSKGGVDNSLNKQHTQLVKLQKEMDKLLADFKAGKITKDIYVSKRKPLQKKRDAIEATL